MGEFKSRRRYDAEFKREAVRLIEIFYNRVSRHSKLGYLSPLDDENKSIEFVV